MINLRNLHAFIVVAEQRSFSRAAKLLFCDSSTASKLVRTLEQEVGARLLIRNTRTIQALTPAGEVLLERGRRLLEQSTLLLTELEGCAPEVQPPLPHEAASAAPAVSA